MKKGKIKNISAWILQVLLGLEFIVAGLSKFSTPIWPKRFTEWGYPDSFYIVIAVAEAAGGILIFIPKLAHKSALAMMTIMLGATITHMVHGEWKSITVTLIIFGLLGLLYFLRKETHPFK